MYVPGFIYSLFFYSKFTRYKARWPLVVEGYVWSPFRHIGVEYKLLPLNLKKVKLVAIGETYSWE